MWWKSGQAEGIEEADMAGTEESLSKGRVVGDKVSKVRVVVGR